MLELHQPAGPATVTARVAAIVLAIAAQPRLSVTELAHVVQLPVSTTHRLVCGLVTGGVVERTAQGRYVLRLDGARRGHDPSALRADITAMILDLAGVVRSRVRFGVWHERGVSALSQSSGRGPGEDCLRHELLPIHATAVGKAMLAFAPGLEVQRVLARPLARYTSRTLVTAGAVRTALATTRSRGTAVAMREYRVDEWALAVPVFGDRGVVAALEVSGTVSLADVKSLVPAVHYAARIFGRGLAEHPAWLPPGTGRTPLRWPIDPTLLAATDDEAYGSSTVAAAGGGNRSRRESACSR